MMTQRTLFPILLVGLPIGLAVSVVAALYLYYHPLDIPWPSRPKHSGDAAALLRRSPNEIDLRDYRRILTTDLAVRESGDAARQRATANWIASTLGPTNLGLPVQIQSSENPLTTATSSAPAPTLLIEIPGTRHKNDVLVIVTGYQTEADDIDDAVSTATLMSLAGAFAGTPQRRTLVFAFLGHEQADAAGMTPLDTLVQSLQLRRLTPRGILDLRVSQPPPVASGTPPPLARVLALAPRDGQPWTSEVREAIAPRKPAGLPFEFADATDAPAAAATLAGWRDAPAPYLLLWLAPAAANDEAAPLTLARSLEGVLQALANR